MNRRKGEALLEVIGRPLERFTGWKYATSYLEQSFAKTLTLCGAQNRSGGDDTLEEIYTIGVEKLTEAGWLEIYAQVQQLWLKYFGPAYSPRDENTRLSHFRRANTPKDLQLKPETTDKHFVEQRRTAVASETAQFKNRGLRK